MRNPSVDGVKVLDGAGTDQRPARRKVQRVAKTGCRLAGGGAAHRQRLRCALQAVLKVAGTRPPRQVENI
jgi:hypothetical protein